jgi:hypothetical protein
MSRGRFISNQIVEDAKINQMSCDTSRLAFTWLITFADCEGRVSGDPTNLRNKLFPRRDDITINQIEGYIKEWATIGLIQWYQANGDQWISFTNFDKHQLGLRKDREAPSNIPAPINLDNNTVTTPQSLRSDSAVMRVNVIKGNVIKVNSEKREGDKSNESAIVKNPGALKALEKFEKRKANGAADLAWLQESLRPLAQAFIDASDILPTKSEYSGWRKFLMDLWEMGIDTITISKSVAKMRHDGLTINNPHSIKAIARDMIAKKGSGDEAFSEVYT